MNGLLALPYWRCKPYVRPKRDGVQPARKRPAETIEQRNKRKEAKALKVAKFHEKALNKVQRGVSIRYRKRASVTYRTLNFFRKTHGYKIQPYFSAYFYDN